MLFTSVLKKVFQKFDVKIPPKELKAAEAKAAKMNKSLEDVLIYDGLINEVELYQKIGEYLNVPYIALKSREIKKEVLNLIPGPVAGTHQVVAFEKNANDVKKQEHESYKFETNFKNVKK